MKTYRIGEAATATGLSSYTIRFYEEKGLLPPASRSDSGYRQYIEGDLRRLRLVHNARLLGLPLEDIEELILGIHDSTCGEYATRVLQLVEKEQVRVDERIAELTRIRTDLSSVAAEALTASRSDIKMEDCLCCVLIDGTNGEGHCQSGAGGGRRFTDETLDVLQCDIESRPNAPTADDLAQYLLGAQIDGSTLHVRFRKDGETAVREFAAAECVCCGGLGWKVSVGEETIILAVSGTPKQLRLLVAAWPQE
jgi:DNA-binding transcriptional MerR regulator